jgi:hypothetical protein
MPSHDGVGLDKHERRAPAPPRLSQYDPNQPISPPEMGTFAHASARVELLAEREVLEDQFVMSAASQRQRAGQYKDRVQHAPILLFSTRRINRRPSGSDSGERHRPTCRRSRSAALSVVVTAASPPTRRTVRTDTALSVATSAYVRPGAPQIGRRRPPSRRL